MRRAKIGFRLGFSLVLFLSVVGCKQKPAAEEPRFKENLTNSPLKKRDAKVNEVIRTQPANRQADLLAQQMRRPPAPQATNPAMDVQRSLQAVEEINRMNRLNQQLRQNQQQKR